MTADIADHVPSYPSIFAVGHRVLTDIFADHVLVEEKVDGSQISFGVLNGTLCARSKNKQIEMSAPDALFKKAVETIQSLAPSLEKGFLYRGEYLSKPHHNALAYERVPRHNIILYDIEDVEVGGEQSSQCFLTPAEKIAEASRIGLECVTPLYQGYVNSPETLARLVPEVSVLGGVKAEGVVVKNYNRFGPDKKILLAKFVTAEFKEVHNGKWGKPLAPKAEILERLISEYGTKARYQKAVQHLRDNGALTQSNKDIGPLMGEVAADIAKECREEIAEKLLEHFWKKIISGVTKGVPAFYKEWLAAMEQTYPDNDIAICEADPAYPAPLEQAA